MEDTDRELILRLIERNPQLKSLYKEHRRLDKAVRRFEQYVSYSASAKLRQQQLKKEKLRGMDRIMSILRQHREAAVAK